MDDFTKKSELLFVLNQNERACIAQSCIWGLQQWFSCFTNLETQVSKEKEHPISL